VLGTKRGIVVLVLDVGKGALAVGVVGAVLTACFSGSDLIALRVFCGLGVIVGHIFPCWLKFRGGKGVAAGLGAWLVIDPIPTLIALAVWGIVVCLSRYVSLGSIVAAVALPVAVALLHKGESIPQMGFAVLIPVLVILSHRSNIIRLLKGKENRISKIRSRPKAPPRADGA
jgi:glycerol-3-phosphate acyltransferase PlsY